MPGVIPQIGDFAQVRDSVKPVLIVDVRFSPEYFCAMYYDQSKPEVREKIPFSRIERLISESEILLAGLRRTPRYP
jgi:hypothetical protein